MSQPPLNTYLNLCTQVYDLSKPKAPEDAYALYRSYVSTAKGHILEPMCGTGRFLLPLIAEGFDVHGFDASAHMLDALHTKAKSLNLKPTVWKGFVEDLKRDEKYGLIFIPSGSFGLILDPQKAKEALNLFYDHLSDDGVLVFESETLKAVPHQFGMWRASVCPREDGTMLIANFLDFPLTDTIRPTICKYELVDGHHIIQTEIEDFKVRLYDPEHLTQMLKGAGFKNINMMKAFDTSQRPDENDEVIVYECRK